MLTSGFSESKRIKKRKGARAGWYKGGNSTCRQHIASAHYAEYRERCQKDGIEENYRCIPKAVRQEREREQQAKRDGQQLLDKLLPKVQTPMSFTPESILITTCISRSQRPGNAWEILRESLISWLCGLSAHGNKGNDRHPLHFPCMSWPLESGRARRVCGLLGLLFAAST